MRYADYTTNDANPVKRWIQNRRLKDALRYIEDRPAGASVLDYGAGDAEFAKRLSQRKEFRIVAFEPASALFGQAEENLKGLPNVALCRSLRNLKPCSFDCIFCLEVFEHLPPEQTNIALSEIERLLKDDGLAVIGVPHELFLPAVIKGIFRMTRRWGAFDGNPRNVLSAALGRPPQRSLEKIEDGLPVHFAHLGFDYRRLEALLSQRFQVRTRRFSPISLLSFVLNSEVYFTVQKKKQASVAA